MRKWTRQTGRGTLRTNEVWEGDRRHTSAVADAEPAPVAPDLVVWGDPRRGVVIGQEVLLPDAPPRAVVESLERAIATPMPGSGPPRQPRRIRVRSSDVAEAVRPLAEALGIQVELAESLPFLDDVFRTFEARFGSPASQGYLDATEVPEPLLAELFRAAARLYRARPWRTLDHLDHLLVRCEEWVPPRRFVVPLGSTGEARGLALYESRRSLAAIASLPSGATDADEAIWNTPSLALLYTPVSALGTRRAAEARRHQWPIATRNAYPVVVGTGRGRESLWPTPGEVRVLIIALRATALALRTLGRIERPAEGESYLLQSSRVQVDGRDVEFEVVCPTPEDAG
ncbi:MAG: hypothetical protein HY321_13940 [Armatimonadetes bacterium]|nr:hypothetical protein [Armatimonadota bacterium]